MRRALIMCDLRLKQIAFGRYLGQKILYFGNEGPYTVKAKKNEVLCGRLRLYDLEEMPPYLAVDVVDIERNKRFEILPDSVFDIAIEKVDTRGITYTFRYPSSNRRRRDTVCFSSMSSNSIDFLRARAYFIPNGVDKREWFMFHDVEFL